ALGNWTFEMRIPLVGSDGDAYDFNITSLPRTVGFKIWFWEEHWQRDGVYPDDPSVNTNVDEITNASTYGNLIIHPLYTLNIITNAGGTTNPAPGPHQYPFGTVVSVTANNNSGYILHHWELDTVNMGSANPYSVTMDQNHTLKAVFYQLMTLSISPLSSTIFLGDSVNFVSALTGGVPSYSYQWYLDGNPVLGANSASWTFTPTSTGIYFVYLKVTDGYGYVVQSQNARVEVNARSTVGGYAEYLAPIVRQTPITNVAAYIAMLTLFGLTSRITRRKRK
ncbi:MAG: PKD domain-containing protein, partial [Candidatus Bathyarchaeia archaeon]